MGKGSCPAWVCIKADQSIAVGLRSTVGRWKWVCVAPHHVPKLKASVWVEGGPEVQHVGLEDGGLASCEAPMLPVCQGQHKCPGAMRAVCMQLLQQAMLS